jgi:hypothetical protein
VAAAWALAATGGDTAGGVDALVRMLGDGAQPSLRADAEVRRDAARALGRLANVPETARAVDPLVRAMRDADQPVAAAAVDALVQLDGAGRTGGRVPVEPVVAILDKGLYYNGPSAAGLGRLLAGMGLRAAPAIPALVKAFRQGLDLAQPLITLARSIPTVAPALRQAFDDDCPGRYGRADPVLAAIASESRGR